MYKKFEFCFIENEYIVLIKYTYTYITFAIVIIYVIYVECIRICVCRN